MKRFAAWLWKEWRDQRAVTVGILIAIPALTGLAYYAFGERIGMARLENVRPIFLAIAVGLVVFAIAGDLFAGENRRKTIHAVRRLPGGMGSAFAAKVTFLAVLLVVVVAWQGLSLALAEHWNAPRMTSTGISDYHYNGSTRSMHLFGELAHFPGSTLWLTGLGFGVIGLWTLLVSSWMGRSGVAAMGAIVLLAVLAVPFFFFFKAHPWFFPGPLRLAAWTAGICAIVALVAAGVSFLKGQRFAGRPFRPVLLGCAVLLVALGGGYAYAQKSLNEWLDISPTDPDFHIMEARWGAGGEHLFVTVYRGTPWNDGRTMHRHKASDPWRAQRGSPLQAWIVDVETGTHRALEGRSELYFQPIPEISHVHVPFSLEPSEALVTYRLGDRVDGSDTLALGWWDARTGERVRVLPANIRDAKTLALVRRDLKARTWVRDTEGRRVWMRGPHVEREGDAFEDPTGLVPWAPVNRAAGMVPGGWFGWRFADGATAGRGAWNFVDAETGANHPINLPKGWHVWATNVLSPDHALIYQYKQKDKRRPHQRVDQLLALDGSGRTQDPKHMPEHFCGVVGRGLILGLRGEKHAYTLHVCNPVTGEDRTLAWKGEPLQGIVGAGVYGRTGDGRILLKVDRMKPTHGTAWVVLDADAQTLRTVIDWTTTSMGPVALLENDDLIMCGNDVISRYRAGGGTERIFPKR